MAKRAPITDTTSSAPSNILPFHRRTDPLAYAPGVVPFDHTNPAHISAWNAIFEFGRKHRADTFGRYEV